MRKFNFTTRIISVWNNLSDSVVSLSADTVDTSKIRLDRFWIDQEIRYNWKADIRIGSRSQVNVILDRYFHICVYLELNIEVLDLRSETLLLLLIRRQAPASPNFWNPSYGHMVPPRDSKFDNQSAVSILTPLLSCHFPTNKPSANFGGTSFLSSCIVSK